MLKYSDLSLNKKLIFITILTALAAMLFVLAANLLSAYFEFKKNTRYNLISFARITGVNCSSAIIFHDDDAARKTLEALKAEPQIESARIYTPDGILFAQYLRDGTGTYNSDSKNYLIDLNLGNVSPDRWSNDQFIYQGGKVIIFEPIYQDMHMIGIVEITSNQSMLHSTMGGILLINLGILFIAFLIAIIIASKAQKTISGPVKELTGTMEKVSRAKDYSIRIRKKSNDELGTLFDRFNEMLSEIQERDDKLLFTQYSIDHMQDAIFWADSSACVVSANNKACELLGYSKEEITKMSVYDFYPDLTPRIWNDLWEYILKQKTFSAEVDHIKKDGSLFPSEIYVSNIDFNGKSYNCTFIRDISERRKLKSQLEQAQKMEAIGTLAGGVAHDLNNILGGLVGYPDLLLMDMPEDSYLYKPLKTIKKSGEKAAAIVQDLLTLARRNVNVQKAISLNDVITEYLSSPEHIKIVEFHSNVVFRVELENDLPNIMGSNFHLSKAIMNLVSNAAEAMTDKNGEVIISTRSCILEKDTHGFQHVPRGSYIIVSVEDRGSGITKEEKKNIFEPFYTKKIMGRSGTGLGMTVVSGVVKDHMGYIDLESTLGEGTRFDLYFPVTEHKKAKDSMNRPAHSYRGSEKILVVDDVEEQRELASYVLEKLGYKVDTVSSGEEALTYLHKHYADLIVLDMIMVPGMDGLDTYKKILEIVPDQKAIIASGYAENNRVKETLRLGAGNYVKKPYTVENLGLAVRKELDEP